MLLVALIREEKISNTISHIKSEYFNDNYYQYFKSLKKYHTDYNTLPSMDIIMDMSLKDMSFHKFFKEDQDIYQEKLGELYQYNKADIDIPYITNETQNWLVNNSVLGIGVKIQDILQKPNESKEKFDEIGRLVPELTEAVNLSLTPKKVTKLNDINTYFSLIKELSEGKPLVATSLKTISEVAGFNLKRGSTNVVIGATGSGKSCHLMGHYIGALDMGYNCLYASFELQEADLIQRYMSNIYDIPMNEIYAKSLKETDDFTSHFKDKFNDLSSHTRGESYVSYFSPKRTGVEEVENYVKFIEDRDNIKIDCVIFDYLSKMKLGRMFGRNTDAEWSQLISLTREMDSFSKANNLVSWTAMQLKPDAQQKEYLSSVDIAYAKGILDEVSFAYAYLEDKETKHHKCFTLKSRQGKKTDLFMLGFNPAYQRIYDIDQSILKVTSFDREIIEALKVDVKSVDEMRSYKPQQNIFGMTTPTNVHNAFNLTI
jgi:hypothetical protein